MSNIFVESSVGQTCHLWKLLKASEIFESYSKKNNDAEPLLSVSQENGVIPRDLLDGRVVMPQSGTSGYKLVNVGDFVISLRTFQGGIEYAQYRGLVSPAYTVLRNKIEIDKRYYRYVFKKEQFINSLSSTVIGIRDGKNISYENFAQLLLPYPPIEEQRKIAAILGTVDEKINGIDRRIKEAEKLKKGLMQKLFSEGIGHTEFKSTELGTLPASWKVTTIEDLIYHKYIVEHIDGNHGELYPKAEEFTDTGIPYVGANAIIGTNLDFSKIKFLSHQRAKQFKKGVAKNGDVLFAHNATVGPVCMLKTELDFVILSTTLTLYRCNNHFLINTFLLYCLQSKSFVEQYRRIMGQSTRNQVPITTQRSFRIHFPPIEEQKKIAEILTEADNKIEHLKKLKGKYTLLKKGLMQQLLTGHKRVAI